MSDKKEISKSSRAEIDAFLSKVASTPVLNKPGERGRLVFAMDATASREATWDQACHIQAEMFRETDALGGLDVQLVYYRGFGEFFASPWTNSSETLLKTMTAVACVGGLTQIGNVLHHTLQETQRKKVNALVFVGDCMEENVDASWGFKEYLCSCFTKATILPRPGRFNKSHKLPTGRVAHSTLAVRNS